MMDINKKEAMKKKFLEILGTDDVAGNVTIALHRLGFSRSSLYLWKDEDPEFSRMWDDVTIEAKASFADEAEYSLRQLVLEKNPTAIIFTLKNLRPNQWSERIKVEEGNLFGGEGAKTYDEYIKRCATLGLDPVTGLRVGSGEGEVEQG